MISQKKKVAVMNCSNCESRKESVFCSMEGSDLKKIDDAKINMRFLPGQVIYYAGNSSNGVFCIQSGSVKLESIDNTGKSHIIQVVSPGGMIGYRSLFSNEPYLCSAIALQETEVCFISRKTVTELVANEPSLAFQLISRLSSEFHQMEHRLQNATSHSAVERTAEALLFLKENYSHQNWTRKEIADYAGTSPETVIRALSTFEEEGLIKIKGRIIEVLDRNALLRKAKITF